MARVSKTSYFCDSCGKEVERARDLTHFDLTNQGRSGRGTYYKGAQAQLCDACTPNLLLSLGTFGFNTENMGLDE